MHGSQGAPAQQCAGATQLGKDHLGRPRPDTGDRVQDRQVPGPRLDKLGDPLREHVDVGFQRLYVREHPG
jgi:hypothetical protein